jgi:hypothetical protein
MDSVLLQEFAKYGVIGLAFGFLLISLIKDKKSMADEMKVDKEKLINLFEGTIHSNTVAIQNSNQAMNTLSTALSKRPCLIKDKSVHGINDLSEAPDGSHQ